jgi:hypothetical protein
MTEKAMEVQKVEVKSYHQMDGFTVHKAVELDMKFYSS